MYLLDTNVVSEVMKHSPDSVVLRWIEDKEDDCFLSAITIGEIKKGIELLGSGKRKRELELAFERISDRLDRSSLAFDTEVACCWATLCAEEQAKGRRLQVLDSMIEATALHWKLTLVTRNVQDFARVNVINPWS